jgi:hypothetical protein
MFYNCTSLTTIYVKESWSLSSLLPYGGNSTFYGCQNLVGGKGTAYDAEQTSAYYARIDGGTDAPGYFTDKAVTGISNVKADIKGQDIYNLKGERLSAPRSGINIIGGRKVIIK